METELRNAIRKLLEEKTVDVAIGYGRVGVGGAVGAVFVTSPDEVDQLVWNNECRQNLAVHLTRPEIKALGKIAIVVKACDARAVVVLANESQIKREEIVVVGVVCEGRRSESRRARREERADGRGVGKSGEARQASRHDLRRAVPILAWRIFALRALLRVPPELSAVLLQPLRRR